MRIGQFDYWFGEKQLILVFSRDEEMPESGMGFPLPHDH